jgi:hypothetical protein
MMRFSPFAATDALDDGWGVPVHAGSNVTRPGVYSAGLYCQIDPRLNGLVTTRRKIVHS